MTKAIIGIYSRGTCCRSGDSKLRIGSDPAAGNYPQIVRQQTDPVAVYSTQGGAHQSACHCLRLIRSRSCRQTKDSVATFGGSLPNDLGDPAGNSNRHGIMVSENLDANSLPCEELGISGCHGARPSDR